MYALCPEIGQKIHTPTHYALQFIGLQRNDKKFNKSVREIEPEE